MLKALRANLWKLQIYWFCHALIFAYVIERLFGIERGLSIQDMVWIEISYAVWSMLFEVPTGALADRWSRRKVMVLSAVFTFFEVYVLIFAWNIWGFMLSALLAALGGALSSGTANALLYDSLKALDRAPEFEKMLGRIRFWGSVSGLIAALGGSWIAVALGLTATYGFSLIGVSINILLSLSLTEAPQHSHAAEETEHETEQTVSAYWQHMREALRFVISHRSLASVVIYATMVAACFTYVDEYSQIYLKDIGVPLALFGVWSGLYMLLEAGFGASAYRLKGWLNERWLFAILLLISAGGLLAAGTLHSLYGLIPLLLAFGGLWTSQPLTAGFLHHRTESHHRATVESCQALLVNLGSVLLGLAFGALATRFSIFAGFQFLGAVLLAFALWWTGVSKRLEEKAVRG